MDSGTGFPSADAQDDFTRARRSQQLAELGRRLRREPDDVALILPFGEVVDALGMVGEAEPPTRVSIAAGPLVGPVLRRVVGMFAARADLPLDRLDDAVLVADLPLKGHERLFRERVPLDAERAARVTPSDPWDYGGLAEGVEAWGFRVMQERREYLPREEIARLWYEDEFRPVVEMLRDAGFVRDSETDADAYMRVVGARYELLRTHEWSDDILDRLQGVERRGRRRLHLPRGDRRAGGAD